MLYSFQESHASQPLVVIPSLATRSPGSSAPPCQHLSPSRAIPRSQISNKGHEKTFGRPLGTQYYCLVFFIKSKRRLPRSLRRTSQSVACPPMSRTPKESPLRSNTFLKKTYVIGFEKYFALVYIDLVRVSSHNPQSKVVLVLLPANQPYESEESLQTPLLSLSPTF